MSGLSFDNEKAMEDWISEHWRFCGIMSAFPALRDGESYRVGEEFNPPMVSVRRQVMIPKASENHENPAPCDVILAQLIFKDSEPHRFRVLIAEPKNATLAPKDLSQLSRYMQGFRLTDLAHQMAEVAPSPIDSPDDIEVFGALVGTGMTWPVSDALAMCPHIQGLVLDIDGTEISLSKEYSAPKFQHIPPIKMGPLLASAKLEAVK